MNAINKLRCTDFEWPSLSIPVAPILIPILDWLPRYEISNLGSDVVAGVTVFVLLIPQGMAYATVDGMPPVYGLYTGKR